MFAILYYIHYRIKSRAATAMYLHIYIYRYTVYMNYTAVLAWIQHNTRTARYAHNNNIVYLISNYYKRTSMRLFYFTLLYDNRTSIRHVLYNMDRPAAPHRD